MSVILGRAMPDVRDGLKPVHRRILFAMHQLNLSPSTPFRKSARVVGEVLGKFHPHGDSAVYNALVRMAQPFSMSAPLVNGHGNFGSTDGDPPAAMRYTECKLPVLTRDVFLSDMGRDAVSYVPNFDGSESEPLVLPARVPNLLINGGSGIAVGMATNIPPHNLGEVVAALSELISNPEVSDDRLMEIVPAPDFPTGGQILGTAGARDTYLTGRGSIVVRACAHSELLDIDGANKRRQVRYAIVVTELPYQVNKAVLIGKIADLVNERKVEGISDLRDESDRNGTRIVIELKRDATVPVVLNNLFKKTQLQSTFSSNVMALDSGRFPVRLTLRDCLTKFLDFRRQTIRRRVSHDLKNAEDRFHIVLGFLIVQQEIDRVVQYIRQSKDAAAAKLLLKTGLMLSDRQADSVLSMQLRRLTSLEQNRLKDEKASLDAQVKDFKATLADPGKLDSIILSELSEISSRHSKPRRSTILADSSSASELDELSLLANDLSIITVTEQGYIKRMPTSAFQTTHRGTVGKRGAGRMRRGDEVAHFFSCMSHDSLIIISKSGVAYQLPAHKVPLASVGSRGVPFFQLIPAVPAGETMASVLAVTEYSNDRFLVLLTRNGYVKKTAVSEFKTLNVRGKRIIALGPSDELKWVRRCTEMDSVIISSQKGYIIRFLTDGSNLRASGRTSRGVISMRLHAGDEIADMDVIASDEEDDEAIMDEEDTHTSNNNTAPADSTDGDRPDDRKYLLAVTRLGTGKRVRATSFKLQRRGGVGVKGIKLDRKGENDSLVAMQMCEKENSIMLVTRDGTIVRTRVGKIPVQGRYSQGVRIQRLHTKDTVAAVAILPEVLAGDDDLDLEEEALNEEDVQ